MAFSFTYSNVLHTNFLTGNDTTGNGSTSTPYKTIIKALEMAPNDTNTLVKVAGGQWATISNTFTFTFGTNSVTTSSTMVGTLFANDAITFEDGQFGEDKHFHKVLASTATGFTMHNDWVGPSMVVNVIKRLDAYHYTGTTNTSGFEAQTSLIEPNGRKIMVSGGWNSDWSSNDNGWTCYRVETTSTSQGPNRHLISMAVGASRGFGNWGANLIFDKLLANHTQMIHSGFVRYNASSATELVASCALWRFASTTSIGRVIPFNAGSIYQPDPTEPVKLYHNTPGKGSVATNSTNSGLELSRPSETKVEMWIHNGANAPVVAAQSSTTGTFLEASNFKVTMNLRSGKSSSASTQGWYANYIWAGGQNQAGSQPSYFDQINLYYNSSDGFYTMFFMQPTQIKDINLIGSGTKCLDLHQIGGVNGFTRINGIIDLQSAGKNISDFNLMNLGYTATAQPNMLCQTNPTSTQVSDIQGLKTIDAVNNIYFKDTNELVIKPGGWFWPGATSSTPQSWCLIGVLQKPQTAFQVDVRLRTEFDPTIYNKIALVYGPKTTNKVETELTFSTTYNTYTLSYDPSSISDWNEYVFPLYICVGFRMPNLYSESAEKLFIESTIIRN